jgi:sigma-B regulation protein RsbU (phosphoserine phosphatase)
VVLGDATGHGIAPALSVTQMHAMLRMAFRLGADLETAFLQVNNQLASTLADDRFITAFIGLVDTATHRMRFHSGGQAPILHFQAARAACARHDPTSFPLAAMPLTSLAAGRHAGPRTRRPAGAALRRHLRIPRRARRTVRRAARRGHPPGKPRQDDGRTVGEILLDAVHAFAQGAPQEDDMTVVLVKRAAQAAEHRMFPRSFDSLQAIFAFTADFCSRHGVGAGLVPTVDFVAEELFTNMVKYSPEGSPEVASQTDGDSGGRGNGADGL